MDLALAFNIAMTLVAFLGGWLLKALRDDIAALKAADSELSRQLSELRAELPDRFVRRDDHKEALDAIFNMLRRIEDKLERKADK